MARKSTGTIQRTKAGAWQAIITLADGSRKRLPPFPKGTSEAMAREKAQALAERAREMGVKARPKPKAPAPTGDSVSAWFERWSDARRMRGHTSVRDDWSRFRHHIEPLIGHTRMAAVSRRQIEQVVRALDDRIAGGRLSWKTAQNVWVLLTKMFDDARSSKLHELRVRDDDPCDGVASPDRGARKAKVYLYPSELLRFVACERVPVRWRRMVAVSIYLGTRAGELDALEWEDVDLERGIVHVHRAIDRSRKGIVKSTKTGSPRRFRIEAAVLPLLRAMKAEGPGTGRVFPPLKLTGRAEKLRAFLQRAGVDRAELFADDATRKPLGWHDLRATSATWLAVRGDEPLRILQRMGHRSFETTQRYVREAEQLREGFGETFPELPLEALKKAETIASIDHSLVSVGNYRAGHGIRTRDPKLGKLVLYQLS